MRIVGAYLILIGGACDRSTMLQQRRSTHQPSGSSEEHGTPVAISGQELGRKSDARTSCSLPGVWLAAVVILRLASAVLNQTAFVPDEYWQSLEIAHRMVFGYPFQTAPAQTTLADSIPERILAAIYLQYLNVVCVSPTVVLSPELWNQVWVPDVGMERGYSRVHTPIALCHPIQDPLTSSH